MILRRVAAGLLAAFWAAFLCVPIAHAKLADIACETTHSVGQGTISLDGAASGGYLGFAAAGVLTGDIVPYQISNGAGGSRKIETGWGTFTDAATDTLARAAEWSTDGAGAELNLGGTSTVCIGPISSAFRETLTTDRSYYVRTNGSDANTCLADTAGGACLTIQGAVDKAARLDANGHNVTIRVATGTYTGAVKLVPIFGLGKTGVASVIGDVSTPSNVAVNVTNSDAFATGAITENVSDPLNAWTTITYGGAEWTIEGFKTTTTETGTSIHSHIAAYGATKIKFGKWNFGASTANQGVHLYAENGGHLVAVDDYTVSGDIWIHATAIRGFLDWSNPITITISGTPTIGDSWLDLLDQSLAWAYGITWVNKSNITTGTRWTARAGSRIDADHGDGGAGVADDFFPGGTNGFADEGGVYNDKTTVFGSEDNAGYRLVLSPDGVSSELFLGNVPGPAFTFRGTSAGVDGPVLGSYQDSASPAASDVPQYWFADGNDASGGEVTYGAFQFKVLDTTHSSHDGAFEVYPAIGGAINIRALGVANGLVAGSPTGSYQGTGTVNATNYFVNGTNLTGIYQPLDSDLTAIAALTTTAFGRGLLDDADAAGGRTSLGLGTAATQNTGTSGANVPLLSGANIWGAGQIISASNPFFGFTDTDTGGDNFFGGNFTDGSFGVWADYNNEVANSRFCVSIDSNADCNNYTWTTAAFFPTTNDGAALGKSGTAWADFWLASGGLIEFDGGTSNTFTCTSGNCSIEGNGLYRAGGTDVAVTDGGTGVSALGTGVVTLLVTPSIANLAAALTDEASGWANVQTTPSGTNLAAFFTDETGSGVPVFGTSPTFTTDFRVADSFAIKSTEASNPALLSFISVATPDAWLNVQNGVTGYDTAPSNTKGVFITGETSVVTNNTMTFNFAGANNMGFFNFDSGPLNGAGMEFMSTTGGAFGPSVYLSLYSASPAANDLAGAVYMGGYNTNTADGFYYYGSVATTILDPADGSEDSRVDIAASAAGVLPWGLSVSAGVVVGDPTGSVVFKGEGTVNAASEYYVTGDPVRGETVIASGNLAAAASTTISSTIPATCAYLSLRITGASSGSTETTLVRFNNDSTAGNYVGKKISGTTVSATTTATIAESGGTHTAAQSDTIQCQIFGYQGNQNPQTTCRHLDNATEVLTWSTYLSATAISRIDAVNSAGGTTDAGTYRLDCMR